MKFITLNKLNENLRSFFNSIIKPYIDKELNGEGASSIKLYTWKSSEDMFEYGYTLSETPKIGDNFYYCATARNSENYDSEINYSFINCTREPRKITNFENGVLKFDEDFDGIYTNYSRDAEHDIVLTVK